MSERQEMSGVFDSVVSLVAGGMAVTRAVKQIGVHYGRLKAYADADPERAARWSAAARDRKLGFFEAGFDEAVRRIEAGEFLDAVRVSVYGDRLTKSGFNKYLRRDPVRAARWKAASEARDRKHPTAGISVKYTSAYFEVMLLALECTDKQPDSRERHALDGQRARNPDFAARYEQMLERRKTARMAAPKPIARPPGQLRRGLLQNALWRRAAAMMSLGDSDDAEDIRMDAIVAILESREAGKTDLTRSHSRKVSSPRAFSLDDVMFSMGDNLAVTRGDLIPASVEMGDIYAW